MSGFADHPVSIAESKADRECNASLWSPREAAIAFLRDLDAGKTAPDMVVIAYRDGGVTRFIAAGGDPLSMVGLIERAKNYMLNPRS